MKSWNEVIQEYFMNERKMKHTAIINGKSFVVEADSTEELKEKLRKIQEFEDNDGA